VIYELRRYELHPGAGPLMRDRFRRVFAPIFAQHGWSLLQAWTDPADVDSFYVLMSFPDEEFRTEAWRIYHEDPLYVNSGDNLDLIIAKLHIHLLEDFDFSPAQA